MKSENKKGDRNMNSGGLDKNDLLNKYKTDELIKYLYSVINLEIAKSNAMDVDLINECVDWLMELKGLEIDFAEDEIKNHVQSIKEKYYRSRNRRFRLMYTAAITIAMLISVQIISFTAFGTDLFGWTKDKFLALIGVETEQGDINIKSSGSREYKTIEEFEKAENIDIMVPMWLPGDMEIDFVMYLHDYAKKQIIICYDKDITLLTIKLNSNISNTDGSEVYIANGFEFYIFEEANIIWWEYDGNFYSLTCGFDVGGYAEKIIENIK